MLCLSPLHSGQTETRQIFACHTWMVFSKKAHSPARLLFPALTKGQGSRAWTCGLGSSYEMKGEANRTDVWVGSPPPARPPEPAFTGPPLSFAVMPSLPSLPAEACPSFLPFHPHPHLGWNGNKWSIQWTNGNGPMETVTVPCFSWTRGWEL